MIMAPERNEAFSLPRVTLLDRLREWWDSLPPVTVESILAAAEQGRLYSYLTDHYTDCYDKSWQAHLELCRDLVDAGLLKGEFTEHYDGSPLFISKDARITIAGRDHLAGLRRNHVARRFWIWTQIVLSAVVSSLVTKLIMH